jgi:hypothetical protein
MAYLKKELPMETVLPIRMTEMATLIKAQRQVDGVALSGRVVNPWTYVSDCQCVTYRRSDSQLLGCMAYWCTCILFGKTHHRLEDHSARLSRYDGLLSWNCLVQSRYVQLCPEV